MPFIRQYWRNDEDTEDTFIMPPKESPIPIALHETVHVVICRLDGLDIRDVIDQDEAAWTRLVEPQRLTPDALMAPEVYMVLNNIFFDDNSVSSDRNALSKRLSPKDNDEIRKDLEHIFQCPCVRAAIAVLSTRMDIELRERKVMSGTSIHEIIDPILKYSPYAAGLRQKLEEDSVDPLSPASAPG
jgi:hypothetical protein